MEGSSLINFFDDGVTHFRLFIWSFFSVLSLYRKILFWNRVAHLSSGRDVVKKFLLSLVLLGAAYEGSPESMNLIIFSPPEE
jgi:hypothetical protein